MARRVGCSLSRTSQIKPVLVWGYLHAHLLAGGRRRVHVLFNDLGRRFADENERHEPEIDMFASMTGKCSTLKVAERDFSCTTVAFSHSPGGRSGFTVPLNDPDDDSSHHHVFRREE